MFKFQNGEWASAAQDRFQNGEWAFAAQAYALRAPTTDSANWHLVTAPTSSEVKAEMFLFLCTAPGAPGMTLSQDMIIRGRPDSPHKSVTV